MTVAQMAPPVDATFVEPGVQQRDMVAMKTGRSVYLTECARCHGIEPIGRYSAQRWQDILDRMVSKSKLNEAEAKALRRYVLSARRVIRQKNTTLAAESGMKE